MHHVLHARGITGGGEKTVKAPPDLCATRTTLPVFSTYLPPATHTHTQCVSPQSFPFDTVASHD